MGKNVIEIVEDTQVFLVQLFRTVALHSPLYENARKLQASIEELSIDSKPSSKTKKDRNKLLSKTAKEYKDKGLTIRQIAKVMGYKHPGSVSHLLSK